MRYKIFFLLALISAALGFDLTHAWAAGWHYYDPECPVSLGDKTMKFVAMQPKKNIDRVCDALPDTGPTVIVLDAGDRELRDMTWDIRILDANAPIAEDNPVAIGSLPAQKYRNGMVNFDHNFTHAGNYMLYAKLSSDDGKKIYIGKHLFTVGLVTESEFYIYLAFSICVLAASSFGFMKWRQKRALSEI
jgi:hypothetical protein